MWKKKISDSRESKPQKIEDIDLDDLTGEIERTLALCEGVDKALSDRDKRPPPQNQQRAR